MPEKRCWWLARWWHRRLRAADREIMLPSLQSSAMRARPLDPAAQHALVDEMWNQFAASPGQEHWRCPCSTGEHR